MYVYKYINVYERERERERKRKKEREIHSKARTFNAALITKSAVTSVLVIYEITPRRDSAVLYYIRT